MAAYAFVLPRFGAGFAGGAEALAAALAEKLAERGDEIEIFTTCAKDNRTWANELPPGVTTERGCTVRRFPVSPRDLERWIPLQIFMSEGGKLTIEEQFEWMTNSVNSLELCEALVREQSRFRAIFLAPYLFGLTFWASMLVKERAVLIPCLHDEVYAYLDLFAQMFREVRGCVFNAHAERDLAVTLYGSLRGGEVGMGFEMHEPGYVEGLPPYPGTDFPYVLYFGRKETGKNVQILIDYFAAAKDGGLVDPAMKLVVAGGGSFADLHRPEALSRGDIIDLGFVSEEEKLALVRDSLCVCQPSTNESFSIVLMEAWRCDVPVLVHGRCGVTRSHVIDSGGGLYFGDAQDFAAAVRYLSLEPEAGKALGRAGARYVAARYSWRAVLERFDKVLDSIVSDQPVNPVAHGQESNSRA